MDCIFAGSNIYGVKELATRKVCSVYVPMSPRRTEPKSVVFFAKACSTKRPIARMKVCTKSKRVVRYKGPVRCASVGSTC